MSGSYMDNNQVVVIGEIMTKLKFSHMVYGENFYTFELLVERLSEEVDVVPVLISERLIEVEEDYRCERVYITGQFRSYHDHEGDERHLRLSVFVKDLVFLNPDQNNEHINEVFLDGYICKEPSYRKTPRGKEISDIMIAVNRENGKSDYIPCICWGRNARYMTRIGVGGHIQVWGRIQSREYIKKDINNEKISRTAYEVSVNRLV